MKLEIIVVFTLMASCTVKRNTIATTKAEPKSCYDLTSLDECALDGECTARFGDDSATAEDVFIACMPVRPPNPDCYGEKACYTNSSGQRAITTKCDYPRWTEVVCTSAELAPCEYTTATACEADKRCALNMAKDLATKESIATGCGYIKGACGNAFACYTNKLTGARAMASNVCRTFPEWEYTECTEADYKARNAP